MPPPARNPVRSMYGGLTLFAFDAIFVCGKAHTMEQLMLLLFLLGLLWFSIFFKILKSL